MIIWNKEATEVLSQYLDLAIQGKPQAPFFFILAWPKHIGKASIALEILKEKMWTYRQQDLLHIQDLSDKLGKKHTLKIEKTNSHETTKTLLDEYNYDDRGIREINNRLQHSSMGKIKVVLIENIERMSEDAPHAFLKTCEEPLEHRLIIATTANESQLLDTIISRALLIKFQALGYDELLKRTDEQGMFAESKELKELTCNMAMGKPGMVIRMHDLLEKDPDLDETLISLVHTLSTNDHLYQSNATLMKLQAHGILDSFLDGRIAYCMNHGMASQWDTWLKVKKMMKTNVSLENILLNGLLK